MENGNFNKYKENLKIALKDIATPIPIIEFTRDNYNKLFPRARIITPIEEVKMGEHQFEKLDKKQRQFILQAVHDTLTTPDIIIKEERESVFGNGDIETTHVYGKSYIINEKKKAIESVVVSIENENISISTHERKLNNLVNKIKRPDQLLFVATKVGLLIEQHTQNNSVQSMVNPTSQIGYANPLNNNISQLQKKSSNISNKNQAQITQQNKNKKEDTMINYYKDNTYSYPTDTNGIVKGFFVKAGDNLITIEDHNNAGISVDAFTKEDYINYAEKPSIKIIDHYGDSYKERHNGNPPPSNIERVSDLIMQVMELTHCDNMNTKIEVISKEERTKIIGQCREENLEYYQNSKKIYDNPKEKDDLMKKSSTLSMFGNKYKKQQDEIITKIDKLENETKQLIKNNKQIQVTQQDENKKEDTMGIKTKPADVIKSWKDTEGIKEIVEKYANTKPFTNTPLEIFSMQTAIKHNQTQVAQQGENIKKEDTMGIKTINLSTFNVSKETNVATKATQQNALLVQTSLENGTCPIIPDENGNIKPMKIVNATMGTNVKSKDLLPLQIIAKNNGYESGTVISYTGIQTAGTQLKPNEHGFLSTYKDKEGNIRGAYYFFAEQTQHPERVKTLLQQVRAENADLMQGTPQRDNIAKENEKPITTMKNGTNDKKQSEPMLINITDPENFMASYIIACRASENHPIELHTTKEAAYEIQEQLKKSCENDLKSEHDKTKSIQPLASIMYNAAAQATAVNDQIYPEIAEKRKAYQEQKQQKTQEHKRKAQSIER